MKIEKNKIVSVTYELKVTDESGERVVEVSDPSNPLVFPYGFNMLLPAFENAILDKKVGDKFEVGMDPSNGYGEVNDYMIVNIPKNVFEIEGKIDYDVIMVGNTVPMTFQDGNVMNGLIVSVKEDNIEMDFNHPLAGKNLYFTGEIVDIRDATQEELKELNKEMCTCDEDCDKGCKH